MSLKKMATRTIKWTILLLLTGFVIYLFNASRITALVQMLLPPTLPKPLIVQDQQWLAQNWDKRTRTQYYHISQGTHTMKVPYQWFIHLPRPSASISGIFSATEKKLSDPHYLAQFGFILENANSDSAQAEKPHPHNPDALPIGFARTPNQSLAGVPGKTDAIGLNCAACHTGQIVYDSTRYIIDGGPATIDLGLFTKALGAAIGQTIVSSKLPFFNRRFDKFAKAVLADQYSAQTKWQLAQDLASFAQAGSKNTDTILVTEGFGRLDALNRIGNEVFSFVLEHKGNYAPIDAPVNYPHIWTSSWFNWVQYDGSIMQPLVRNAGEALGVSASLDVTAPINQGRFSSSIPLRNLHWIEHQLAGTHFDPSNLTRNDGLKAPKWPEQFKQIDYARAKQGQALYRQYCQGCHLPPLGTDSPAWADLYKPISWYNRHKQHLQTDESLLHLKVIAHRQIGTDTAQGDILAQRKVDTSGYAPMAQTAQNQGMGLDSTLCIPKPAGPALTTAPADTRSPMPGDLIDVRVQDGSQLPFAWALGASVQQTIDAWMNDHFIDERQRQAFAGERPNCLQAGMGYRARPLNGIWATAPFLHNGSVPTLMDLLSPVDQRPKFVQLGHTEFDVNNVGLKQPENISHHTRNNYASNNLFILDTSISGNHNTGHEFSSLYNPDKHYSEQPHGVIGPLLPEADKRALIEYLKTL